MISIDDLHFSQNQLLIGDRRLEGTGEEVTRYYAGTGLATRNVRLGSVRDVDAAVASARQAFPIWRALPASRRRDIMLRAAALLAERAESIAQLAAADAGLTVGGIRAFVGSAVEWLTYYAGWVDKLGAPTVPTDGNSMDYVRYEPYGVIGVITPANSAVSVMLLAPLLAAGNCAVFKPSEFTASAAAEFFQVFLDAGMPPGVVNSVPGGADVGEALVRHPGIDKVHFTGSCAVGARVGALSATFLKPVGMELGGKSASIVFPDADLDVSADIATRSLVRQSGQSCVAGTRILVHESIADELLARTMERVRQQKIGLPLAADSVMGPVVSQAACDRIMGVIERARRERYGRLAQGGERLGGDLAGGYFIAPTIFADVDNQSPLAQEETFGPVISFIRFSTDEQAVELANQSDYGLAAYIQTTSLRRAHRTAAQLDVGTIWINGAVGILPGGPFGGAKQSGYGRVGGVEGVHEFMRPKNIWVGGL